MERIEFAHSLRGIAPLLVILSHLGLLYWYWHSAVTLYTGITPYNGQPPLIAKFLQHIPIVNFGALGVALFFLISGFVIPFALEKQTRLQFLVGRFFRIWPTYLTGLSISLLSLVIASAYFKIEFVPTLKSILGSILIAPGLIGVNSIDGIIWTLEIEIKFYLLLALIPQLARGKTWPLLLTGCLFLVCNYMLKQHDYVGLISRLVFVFRNDVPYFCYMFIGILFNNHFRKKVKFCGLIIGIVSLFMLFVTLNRADHDTAHLSHHLIPSYVTSLTIFLIFYLGRNKFKFPAFFDHLANISYPLYAVHPIMGYVFLSIFLSKIHQPTIALILAVSLAVGLAILIHKFIEVPSNELGKKLGKLLAKSKDSMRRFPLESRQS